MKPQFTNGTPSLEGSRVEVLVINPNEDAHSSLQDIFRHSNWKVYRAFNCREALDLLREHHIPVIICEQNLPDGNWKTLLEEVEAMPARPRLIVSSRLADHQLWGEVLNLGAYDVLPTPFDPREVFRVSSLAWHSSRFELQRSAVALKPPKWAGCADAPGSEIRSCG